MKDKELEILIYLREGSICLFILDDRYVLEGIKDYRYRWTGNNQMDIISIENPIVSELINSNIHSKQTFKCSEKLFYESFPKNIFKSKTKFIDTDIVEYILGETINNGSQLDFVLKKLKEHLENIKRNKRITKLFEDKTL